MAEQNLNFARSVCDRACIVYQGSVRYQSAIDDLPQEVYEKYCSLSIQRVADRGQRSESWEPKPAASSKKAIDQGPETSNRKCRAELFEFFGKFLESGAQFFGLRFGLF